MSEAPPPLPKDRGELVTWFDGYLQKSWLGSLNSGDLSIKMAVPGQRDHVLPLSDAQGRMLRIEIRYMPEPSESDIAALLGIDTVEMTG